MARLARIWVGGQLLHAHCLPQKAEDNDDAGETGNREHDGRGNGKHGEQKENFQQHRDFFRRLRPTGQGELHCGHGQVLSRKGQNRHEEDEEASCRQRRDGLLP